jgi:hypothetical protein
MTLFASQAAMATTQLARHTFCDDVRSWRVERTTARKQPLRMSWVVVTDENGKRHLRMRWTSQHNDER